MIDGKKDMPKGVSDEFLDLLQDSSQTFPADIQKA
jgi:hypothetical protein